ncbi:MAG: DNA-3-methyladenine glycosylase I [Alphaproteobacteria bacterium]|jgi:DNA-3-methyladenine glycosylase I
MESVIIGADSRPRCGWCGEDAEYLRYHDEEWGVPQRDDRKLFEKLCLEGFQAGLSWITILRKRDNFRAAFHGFDPERLAVMDQDDVERLMGDAGIVRNRLKINATISNAQAWLAMMEARPDGFSGFVWESVNGETIINRPKTMADVPGKTPAAELLSKRLKKAGFRFVGPTICYAFMQSMGMVDDHLEGCWKAR